MNRISTEPEVFESTYALIVRSEEKQRSRFEALVYVVLVISTLFAVSQFGREAMSLRFRHVESGPLVRSSYHAWEHVQ